MYLGIDKMRYHISIMYRSVQTHNGQPNEDIIGKAKMKSVIHTFSTFGNEVRVRSAYFVGQV